MAYGKRSRGRRTPIKSTKAYKRGMLQTAGIVALGLAFFPQAYKMIFDIVEKVKGSFNGGGTA